MCLVYWPLCIFVFYVHNIMMPPHILIVYSDLYNDLYSNILVPCRSVCPRLTNVLVPIVQLLFLLLV